MSTATTHNVDHVKLCQQCSKPLNGRQTKYCSRKCHNLLSNVVNQNYVAQQERGMLRKLEFVRRAGGQCCKCGYNKNLAALVFHRTTPSNKTLELNMRAFSNNSLRTLEKEFKSCSLVCSNCHMEGHYPHLDNLI